MAFQKPQVKTDQEWKKINFQNSLGPQIGGLIHDAVALTIAGTQVKYEDRKKDISLWLDTLYKIAEQKKSQILKDQEPKPMTEEDFKRADKMGKDKLEQETQEQGAGIDTINDDLNRESAENKQIPF